MGLALPRRLPRAPRDKRFLPLGGRSSHGDLGVSDSSQGPPSHGLLDPTLRVSCQVLGVFSLLPASTERTIRSGALHTPPSRSLSVCSVPEGCGHVVSSTTLTSAPTARDPLPSDTSRAPLHSDRPAAVGP